MKAFCIVIVGISILSDGVRADPEERAPIDRHALVTRYDIDWPVLAGQIPLGNGNFAFNADGTGLETVGGNTMSHWCWHSFPLPPGVTPDQIKPWATPDHGRLKGNTTKPPPAIYSWERLNPQPLNLGRLGFIGADGARLQASEVRMDSRHLDLWSGILTSRFTYLGAQVAVETCVDPQSDTVAVHVVSPLLSDGRLKIMLDFPAPTHGDSAWTGNYMKIAGHQTEIINRADDRLELNRTIDDAHYKVALAGSGFVVNPAPAYPPLEIVGARYGHAGGAMIDVGAKVTSLLQDGGIAVTASNGLGGDPAHGQSKQLEITYRLNGVQQTETLPEGATWNCTAGSSPHRFLVTAKSGTDTVDLTCHFGPSAATDPTRSVAEIKAACADAWPAFWKSGGAIDLSGSKDPRWNELERRIVLSQYELAVQSAGDNPPAEVGLTGSDPWEAKWHFEMIWWHLAHYALWDRWSMADKALSIYQRTEPVARAIADNFDYRGLMWPKSTGPNGYNDGFPMEMSLLWKDPHPIFFAELDYRLHPSAATLAKWKDVVFGTADFLADYPTLDSKTGLYSLAPDMPPSELGITVNTVFDLAYWRWALDTAQIWRGRLGLARDPHWDEIRQHLAPLPVEDGVYTMSPQWHTTYTKRNYSHPDPIGVFGMLPPTDAVDPATSHRTLLKVMATWKWVKTWGWDYPWIAMSAARLGEPQLAVDTLLNPAKKNHYDQRGLCVGGPDPCYLPGNGGLLYAVAMMAAGWDGAPDRPAPGFPADGSWTVKWEDLKKAP